MRRDQKSRWRRQRYLSRKQAGICVFCPEPAVRGRVHCATHRPLSNPAKARYMQEYSAKRRASGVCITCPHPSRPGKGYCQDCAKIQSGKTTALIQGKRRKAVELFGCVCKDCGYKNTEWVQVFDFDHLDRTQKIGDISSMCANAGWNRIEQELKKCEMVCSNCHRIRTAKGNKES